MNNQAENLLLEMLSLSMLIIMMTHEYEKELDHNTKKRIAWETYKIKMQQKNVRKEYVKACDEEVSNEELYTWLAGEDILVNK